MCTLLTICSQISIKMSFLHLYPLLWQRDHIATNKWCQPFLLIKVYQKSMRKIREYAWPTNFDSFLELIFKLKHQEVKIRVYLKSLIFHGYMYDIFFFQKFFFPSKSLQKYTYYANCAMIRTLNFLLSFIFSSVHLV